MKEEVMNASQLLKEGDSIESLEVNNLYIIQNKYQYKFTTDAVLLANFVKTAKGKKCVDLCSGSGIVGILLKGKKDALTVELVELQSQLADMSSRSVLLNNMQDSVTVHNCSAQQFAEQHSNAYNLVVCNPPYRKAGSGECQLGEHIALCRHEIAIDLSEVIRCASKLLNNKGQFYIVHQSNRLAEICYLGKQFLLEPKEILPVCSYIDSQPNLVLVKMVKCGSVDCILHKPMVLYNKDGSYTEQAKLYYNKL